MFSKFSRCLPFSKWLPKHGINMVKIQKFNIVRYHQNLICEVHVPRKERKEEKRNNNNKKWSKNNKSPNVVWET
jgi:hypothetical protein